MQKRTAALKCADRDVIKYIAVIPMAIGHFTGFVQAGKTDPGDSLLLFLLTQMSLIAPPIFFYFIAEGFRYTRSVKRYMARLLTFAVITQIPFCLTANGTLLTTEFFRYLNVFFTLFLGAAALAVCGSGLKRKTKILLVAALDAVTVVFNSQWMIFGIPIILGFYYFRDHPKKRLICFAACVVTEMFISYMSFETVLGLEYFITDLFLLFTGYAAVTVFYNGERGKHPKFSKWFFYIFYPAHLFVVYAGQLYTGRF